MLKKHHAWTVLAAATINNLISFGFLYSVGIWFAAWVEYYDETRALVATAAALPLAVVNLGGPTYGLLVEKLGMRRAGIVGSVIMAVAHMATAYSPNVYFLCVVYGPLVGFGAGLTNMAASYSLNAYFTSSRTFAEGIMSSGASLGAFACSILQQYLIDLYGWKGAILIVGGICLNLILCTMILIEPRDDDSKELKDVNHVKEASEKQNFALRSMILFSKKEMLVMAFSELLSWFAMFVPYVHLAERAQLLGIDDNTSAWISSVIGLVGIAAKPFISVVTSYTETHPLISYGLMQLIAGVACIASPSFSTKQGLFAFAVAMGLASTSFPLAKSSVTFLLGNRWFGIAFSWILLLEGIGSGIGPVIGGWIYDVTQSYDTTFYACGGVYLSSGSIVFLYIVKYVGVRRKTEVINPTASDAALIQ